MSKITKHEITLPDTPELAQIDQIMAEAFPPSEQVAATNLMKGVSAGAARLFAYKQGDEVAAFAYVLDGEGMTYLLFLAVKGQFQGQGIGGYVLDDVAANAHGPLALDIETLECLEECENPQQRLKRKAFYEKHGFEYAGYRTVDVGIVYDTMKYGGTVSPEAHKALMTKAYTAMEIPVDIYMR